MKRRLISSLALSVFVLTLLPIPAQAADHGGRVSRLKLAAQSVIGAWSPLSPGVVFNGFVYTLAFHNGVLYAGGQFTDAGGDPDADYIAKFSGGVWSAVAPGVNDVVREIEFNGNQLYIGGQFLDAGGDSDADYIAKLDGGVWASLNGPNTGLNDDVSDIDFRNGVLYAGGGFINAGGDSDADGVAKFESGAWSSLGGPGTGLNGSALVIEFFGAALYAGGTFNDAGGHSGADYVAKFESGDWDPVGAGGLTDYVFDLKFNDGVLYIGGNFLDAGGDPDADFIAKFDGGVWSSLGPGTGLNNLVEEINFYNGVLYASGQFSDAGGDSDADFIAKFDGSAWSSLNGPNTGLNNSAISIVIAQGDLYAGGAFTNAGGDPDATYLAVFGIERIPSPDEPEPDEPTAGKAIASSGVTSLQLGRIIVSVPASAIPSGESDCKVSITQKGESGAYGFSLDDTVWDVSVLCGGHEVSIFFDALTVCIRPKDGVVADKNVYHRHGSAGFAALSGGSGPAGYACGSTRLLSLFTLGELTLPATGFAPGQVTQLGSQPAELAYRSSDLTLNLPTLDLELDIVGVPRGVNGWDVSWLTPNEAGYLYGTAFPTWEGNSVLTAHVWNADNTAGPFYDLKHLAYGDQFSISAYGYTYTYEVRSNLLVTPSRLGILRESDLNMVTLVTCESFNEASGAYRYRRAVQAVLVSVD